MSRTIKSSIKTYKAEKVEHEQEELDEVDTAPHFGSLVQRDSRFEVCRLSSISGDTEHAEFLDFVNTFNSHIFVVIGHH